jgi:predicted nucleotidyltransferase
MSALDPRLIAILREVAGRHASLELLIVHGSRARGEATATSDWDFAYLGGHELDPAALVADLSLALDSDRVDLVDLSRASAVLRYRAARDAVVVFERRASAFERFAVNAISFWCDVAPLIREGYERVLAELDA